ncbi:MAG: M20/M25/M40 family metallo-hydrolase [Chitinophagaceae bacterium]|jgi:aminopeptidase YwaD
MKTPRSHLSLFVLVLLVACSPSAKLNKENLSLENKLRAHVGYLADDKLEGRRTGTAGEKLAAEYISQKFQNLGLTPKGTDGFLQAFSVNEGKKMKEETSLIIAEKNMTAGKDFFVFPFSANGTIQGQITIGVLEVGSPWFIDVNTVIEDNASNPHFDLPGYVYDFSKIAKQKGATAVFWYNSGNKEDKLTFNAKDKSPVLTLPVFYLQKSAYAHTLMQEVASLNIKASAMLGDKIRSGTNVVGFIDNGAANTIVLGAHFDHLGYGEDGNSRYARQGSGPYNVTDIHNGADDNASGAATMLELASLLKASKAKNNNYLFIAFSGEELGLYGSKHFTDNPTIDLKSINYMINMDMVGRLNDSTKALTIGGYGTSPVWASMISQVQGDQKPSMSSKAAGAFQIKIDSAGSGPSDHTSFYRKDIPVLFYFTGLHTDYHKPSDDANLINYAGMVKILRHVQGVVEKTNESGKLSFLKTKEAQTTTTARFSVSMGIMPDYTYSGNGVRADGVTEGRPAQKAGLKAGDIILQIGDYKISSMEAYMQTLGKFKKGDSTSVIYQRGKEQFTVNIQF